ncbi:MAG TPA: aromatic amino acid transport family protein, partial [Gammaproteobacteria bacterium]|nr:aromatic amino acid transport family protein [Gammaproteobacteria bacterium]
MINKDKVFGGILLASGTAIGAGMLALPLSTANSGFIPSGFAFVVCWFFMTLAALLLLEVNLRFSGDKDLISMTHLTFGVFGKTIAWIVYLLFLYALIVAYLTGSSAWVLKVLEKFHLSISPNIVVMSLIFVFGLIISYGTLVVEHINRYLMYGLVLTYILLIVSASPSVEMAKLSVIDFTHVSLTLPLIITAFGFAPIIPSLTQYLNRDVLALRYVVMLGSFIPLVIYLLWEWVALGIIPLSGSNSFETLIRHHDDGTGVALALEQITGNVWITQSSRWFTLFAIFTSLLGVSLALFHFLADGLRLQKKTGLHRLFLLGCVYMPPLLVVLFYPS